MLSATHRETIVFSGECYSFPTRALLLRKYHVCPRQIVHPDLCSAHRTPHHKNSRGPRNLSQSQPTMPNIFIPGSNNRAHRHNFRDKRSSDVQTRMSGHLAFKLKTWDAVLQHVLVTRPGSWTSGAWGADLGCRKLGLGSWI